MKIQKRILVLLNCFWSFIAPSVSKHQDSDLESMLIGSQEESVSSNSFSLAVLTPDENYIETFTEKCSYNCGNHGGNSHHQITNTHQQTKKPHHQTKNVHHQTKNVHHQTKNVHHQTKNVHHQTKNVHHQYKKHHHKHDMEPIPRISFQLSDKFFSRSFSNATNQNFHPHQHHHHHSREQHRSGSHRHHHFHNHQESNQKWKSNEAKGSKKIRRHGKNNAFHGHHHHFSQELPQQPPKEQLKEPSFDESSPSFVTAQLGSSAFLSCRIHDLEDKSVSWVRNRDAHILTLDRYTFIADSRFVSLFDAESETWTLQVKFIEKDDAGRYECQVSTEPKRSHFVTLAVIAPRVEIPGGSELHVRSGSDVMLKCVISRALTPPPHVFWYHEERRVLDGSLGDLVHQAPLTKVSKDSSVASLTIQNAKQKHAGNYTCAPAGLATTASVILHVLNGEHPAAMQHGSNVASNNRKEMFQLICSIFFNLCFKFLFHKSL